MVVNNIFSVIPGYTPTIGIMGSASGTIMRDPKAVTAAQTIGRIVAEQGIELVNGACPGLPDVAAQAAKAAGGRTLGISPGISICSHMKKYKSPIEHYDQFIFTGMGLMMRDIINIRSSDGVIILPGGTGTLNEFTVAYDEGKPMGILTGHGGCANHIDEILDFCARKPTDRMVFSDDPEELVFKLIDIMKSCKMGCYLDDHLVGDEGEVTKIEELMDDA